MNVSCTRRLSWLLRVSSLHPHTHTHTHTRTHTVKQEGAGEISNMAQTDRANLSDMNQSPGSDLGVAIQHVVLPVSRGSVADEWRGVGGVASYPVPHQHV